MHTVQSRAFARVDEYRNTTGTQEKKIGRWPRELHGIRWDFKQQGWYCILPPVSFTQLDCVEPGAQREIRKSESGYAGHGVFDICSGRAMWVWIFDLLRTHYPAAAMLFPFMQTSKVLPIGEVLNLTPGFVKGNGLSWCPMCIQTQKFFGAGLCYCWHEFWVLGCRCMFVDIPPPLLSLAFMQRQFPHPRPFVFGQICSLGCKSRCT